MQASEIASTRRLSCGFYAIVTTMMATASAATAADQADSGSKPSSTFARSGLNLEEYKATLKLGLKVSQSRLFRTKNKIIRTSVADPGIAEPVVLAENVLLFLGKAPGRTTIEIWDDAGGEATIKVLVHKPHDNVISVLSAPPWPFIDSVGTKSDSTDRPADSGHFNIKEISDPRQADDTLKGKLPDTNVAAASRMLHAYCSQVPVGLSKSAPKPATEQPAKAFESQLTIGKETVTIANGFKTSNTTNLIDLTPSCSRSFHSKSHLLKYVISDPRIAEPTPISMNEFVLLGKKPGRTQFEVIDDTGQAMAADVRVRKPSGWFLSAMRLLGDEVRQCFGAAKSSASFSPAETRSIAFSEQKIDGVIDLEVSKPKFFETGHKLVRTSVSDPGYGEPILFSAMQLAFVGKTPGQTTVFLWDDPGHIGGFKVRVGQQAKTSQVRLGAISASSKECNISADSRSSSLHEVELWSGSRKDVISVSKGPDSDCCDAAAQPIILNNQGVLALNKHDYALAIQLLNKALKCAPTYKSARNNLAIAYNNFGLTMQENPGEAIKQFHQAAYLDPQNKIIKANLNEIIRKLGWDPDNFADRTALGDAALSGNDTVSGIVEYQMALELKDNDEVRAKLNGALRRIGRKIEQFGSKHPEKQIMERSR